VPYTQSRSHRRGCSRQQRRDFRRARLKRFLWALATAVRGECFGRCAWPTRSAHAWAAGGCERSSLNGEVSFPVRLTLRYCLGCAAFRGGAVRRAGHRDPARHSGDDSRQCWRTTTDAQSRYRELGEALTLIRTANERSRTSSSRRNLAQ